MTEPTTYEIKKETNWTLTISLIIWTVVLICMTGFLILQNIMDTRYIRDFIPVIIVMMCIAFFTLNAIRWQLYGREIITLTEKGIEIENKGTFFNDHTTITYIEMDSISLDDDDKRAIIFISPILKISGGRIKILYLGRIRRVGQNITIDQAEGLTKKIKEEFEHRKSQYMQSNFLNN